MSIMRTIAILFLALSVTAPSARAEDASEYRIGQDVFAAGEQVSAGGEAVDDVFLAGETVSVSGPITGNAHLAGRKISVQSTVGGDIYAFGMNVDVAAPVSGDVTAAGFRVTIADSVGGDLRASGARVTVKGDVAGYALMAGEDLRLDGAVAGDAAMAGETFRFGDAATVAGKLTIYADDPQSVSVPESVAPEARIERREAKEFDRSKVAKAVPVSSGGLIAGFIGGVIFLALIATLIAALAPEGLARLRHEALARPARTIWMGILGLSVPLGGAILLALTLVGLIASPALVLLAVLFGFAGYIVGVYALGVAVLIGIGRTEPQILRERALAALVGALLTSLLLLIPLLGWLFGFGLALLGCGAILERAVRPRFFAETV
ncbi:hypothetical protein [Tropicimonas sp. IMCC34043]|uniref:hypothetical protein n=1 Tax=Tropicimonas sp. IMCC34043 TaxID=2248760 RepID=UPI000E223B02|nr:hypothetical protein [Tropicimonas sp. IMCC34043]